MFVTVITTARHWSPYDRRIQSTHFSSIYLRLILIFLLSTIKFSEKVFSLPVLWPKFCMVFSILPCVLHAPFILFSLTSPKACVIVRKAKNWFSQPDLHKWTLNIEMFPHVSSLEQWTNRDQLSIEGCTAKVTRKKSIYVYSYGCNQTETEIFILR